MQMAATRDKSTPAATFTKYYSHTSAIQSTSAKQLNTYAINHLPHAIVHLRHPGSDMIAHIENSRTFKPIAPDPQLNMLFI